MNRESVAIMINLRHSSYKYSWLQQKTINSTQHSVFNGISHLRQISNGDVPVQASRHWDRFFLVPSICPSSPHIWSTPAIQEQWIAAAGEHADSTISQPTHTQQHKLSVANTLIHIPQDSQLSCADASQVVHSWAAVNKEYNMILTNGFDHCTHRNGAV